MSEALGMLLGFQSDMMISAQIEYSFEKLDSVELEPLTFQDFRIIEENSEFIEQNLLNQMQVFYKNQVFILHFEKGVKARLRTKI